MSKHSYNVAHIMPWQAVGGTEQATLRIARAVESGGFRSIAFCLQGAPVVTDFFATAGIETAWYEGAELSYRRPKAFLRAMFQLCREFNRRNIDLVHCADVLAGDFAALAGRFARVPVLCHVRNRVSKIYPHDRRHLRAVNKFVFVSQDTWRQFAYPVPPDRGLVVYDGIEVDSTPGENAGRDGIDQDVRREFNIPAATKIIGMVARVDPQKDFETLARAAARVVANGFDVRFLIVGGCSGDQDQISHYEKVRHMLAEHNVTPYFIFTDFRRDVRRLIKAMDIFVLSTHYEGLPLVLLEALAQGRPVVATAVDGVPEIIIDKETGLLHEHRNDEQLAAHLMSLLRDEAGAERLGKDGQSFVQANFGMGKFTNNMIDLYRRTLRVEA